MAAQRTQIETSDRDGRTGLGAFASNAAAVRAVAESVQSTLGPKGLNCMLVDRAGDVTITNDGSTILSLIDASHPAARIMVRAARAQEREWGDGTTTTAVLADALVSEGLSQARNGVPVSMLADGIADGVRYAVEAICSQSRRVEHVSDTVLEQVVRVAARGDVEITSAVMKAAALCGLDVLVRQDFDLRDSILLSEGGHTEAFAGIVLQKDRMNRQMPTELRDVACLVIDDALEPEQMESSAIGTESGFAAYMANVEKFKASLDAIISLGVNVVAVHRSVSDLAEERLTRSGCLVVRRVGARDISRLAGHTGATPVKVTSLADRADLSASIGRAGSVLTDERRGWVVVRDGAGTIAASIVVAAGTREVAEERMRIAEDACGALQSAARTGVVPGGGSVEVFASGRLTGQRIESSGMLSFGRECVARALRRPLAQIAANAGYNPLEAVCSVEKAQRRRRCASLGVDCESGRTADMAALGIWDPTGVKTGALETAAEVACAILRVDTIVRMRDVESSRPTAE